jgi:hypothetical protein
MRRIVIIAIGLAIAFWLDQRYYGGTYSAPIVEMIHQIIWQAHHLIYGAIAPTLASAAGSSA